jgi:alkanesulfonate monooxygenase SsuD/methylene tetrahydromethanopterin reductase-like flavin-dependent oxidoreductase (luciferase family)
MSEPRDHFVLAVELDGDGAHPAAWRESAHPPDTLLTAARIVETVRAAERAGFTAATFADSPLPPDHSPNILGRIDAVQRAAFAAPITSSIGLIPVAHAVYSEPFHVGTQLATVDHVSGGRAGWIVGVDADAEIAAEYGRVAVDQSQASADAADAVEVARRLWDTWEDGAVIRDRPTGRYLDRTLVHYTDFVGDSFSVKGPAIIPRPPQGQVVVFAARNDVGKIGADVVLISSADEAAAARAEGARRVVLEIEVILDSAGRTAADRLAALDAHTVWPATGRRRVSGTSAELVELIAELASFDGDTAIDGIRLFPAVLDTDLEELGRAVLPELRRRGLFISPIPGQSLRDSLGLERPANRYASTTEGAQL